MKTREHKKDKRGMFTSFWKTIRIRRRVMSFINRGLHTMGMEMGMYVLPEAYEKYGWPSLFRPDADLSIYHNSYDPK